MSMRSQRERSCSRSRIGSPPGPVRDRVRDAWISISAARPWTSGSFGTSPARMRPSRSASSHNAGRIPSSPRGRRVAFVEDEVDDLQHRGESDLALRAFRHLQGGPRLGERPLGPDDALGDRGFRDQEGARDLLGREAAEQAKRQGNARLGSSGWQAVNMSRSRSSPMSSSRVASSSATACSWRSPDSRPSSRWVRSTTRPRRKRSIARRLAVAISEAPGLSGTPQSGQRPSAATSASCASSSASPRRAACAPARGSGAATRPGRQPRSRDASR